MFAQKSLLRSQRRCVINVVCRKPNGEPNTNKLQMVIEAAVKAASKMTSGDERGKSLAARLMDAGKDRQPRR